MSHEAGRKPRLDDRTWRRMELMMFSIKAWTHACFCKLPECQMKSLKMAKLAHQKALEIAIGSDGSLLDPPWGQVSALAVAGAVIVSNSDGQHLPQTGGPAS